MLQSMVLRRIGTIARIVASVSDVKFRRFSLQKGQHIYVVRVCEHPGLNLAELTRLLNVDKSTTTKAVQKLEKAGYILKKHPEGDRKSLVLYPTERAKEVYRSIIDEENVRAALIFRGFDEEEKRQAMAYLDRMCYNIEEYK